jgi:hypothetical protein
MSRIAISVLRISRPATDTAVTADAVENPAR